jgi:hypothetical protein
MPKRVITFSLWGNKSQYMIGSIKNAELAQIYYPDFECWFYIHKETVTQEIINKLENLTNVKIIYKFGDLNKVKPMMWRFEAIDEDDVDVMMSRDTDTRIWEREVIAVNEWLLSGKIFHIMRDHPDHGFEILGGMFGTKKIPEIPSWKKIIDSCEQGIDKFCDQDFLKNHIYPIIKENSVIHANFHKYEKHAISFSEPYNVNYNFVGEYVYHDDSRSLKHINRLKNELIKFK